MPISAIQKTIYRYALKHFQTRIEEIETLISGIHEQLGEPAGIPSVSPPVSSTVTKTKKRNMTPEHKAHIAATQKKRWAAFRVAQKLKMTTNKATQKPAKRVR